MQHVNDPASTVSATSWLPASQEITMFTTSWCGYCVRLKGQLNRAGIPFTEINIEQVPEAAQLVATLNGGNHTVPTVLFPDGTSATNPAVQEIQARLAP